MGDDIFPARNYSISTRKSLLMGIKLELFKYLSIPAILLLASTSVQATLTIVAPTSTDCDSNPFCWTVDTNSALDADDVKSRTGESEELVLLYKAEFDEMTEEGPFQSLYDITWDTEVLPDGTTEATGGTIEWTGNGSDTEIDCSISCYLVVKDGSVGDPNQYIFDISEWDPIEEWDGIMPIVLSGFWVDPYPGAISHVAIYGVVPLPATFWLFGTALIGFVGFSRRRSV